MPKKEYYTVPITDCVSVATLNKLDYLEVGRGSFQVVAEGREQLEYLGCHLTPSQLIQMTESTQVLHTGLQYDNYVVIHIVNMQRSEVIMW